MLCIINGNNGIIVIILIGFVVVQLFWGIRKGKISFKGHGLSIGQTRENELRIVREQLQYTGHVIDGTFTKLPEQFQENCYAFKCKYWLSLLKDFIETMIIYNHIREDNIYVELKQESAYNLMLSHVDNDPYWKSPEFRGLIYNTIEEIIKDLIKVRKTYESNTN